jgi:protein O-GlcNAc transferase
MTIDQAMQIASRHFRDGRHQEAEAIYQQILSVQPNFPPALNRMAVIAAQAGRLELAAGLVRQAIAAAPDNPDYHFHLGTLLGNLGQIDQAMACYQRALTLKPDYPAAHTNLGVAWHAKARFDQAIACYQKALAIQPDFVPAQYNLANAWRDMGQNDQAVLGYQRTLEIDAKCLEAHNNLGLVWLDTGHVERAIASFQNALVLNPQFVDAHYNLGNALKANGLLDQAIACYQRALSINPNHAEAHSNLGNALKETGQLDEAAACHRRALALKPGCVAAHDSLLRTLPFLPDSDPESLFAEFQNWNRQHAEPLKRFVQPHANERHCERRLRIGYVSPDFRNHPVGWFISPLLASHDRAAFQVFCYAHVPIPDKITAQVQSHADVWRNIAGLSDEQVAALIRRDQIDILVDLAMHTADNRLLVFARKPAPVQVTYLAYAGGPALDTIDYRLTDSSLDPDHADDRYYMQKSVRLPGTYWCYTPSPAAMPVNELPALTAENITLGCLNNFSKVSPMALETWANLLGRLPNARLLLHIKPGSHRDRVMSFLADRGLAPDRLEIVGWMSLEQYFDTYRRMDVALDSFPCAGATTTCDALWMGVPVVTLAGRTAIGRAGVSLLSHVGIPDLVARSPAQYIQIAADLAADLPRLAKLRQTLRQRMKDSPLMDIDRFARDIEAAYRTMWRTWCASQSIPK